MPMIHATMLYLRWIFNILHKHCECCNAAVKSENVIFDGLNKSFKFICALRKMQMSCLKSFHAILNFALNLVIHKSLSVIRTRGT